MLKTKAKEANETERPLLSLTPKQERFCVLYTKDKECFGNGSKAYIEAYSIDPTKKGSLNAARSSASELLTNPNILERIRELTASFKVTDEVVDQELSFLISQRADFTAKIRAISEYNKLRGRISHRLQIERPYEHMTDEELDAAIEEAKRGLGKG